MNVVDLHPDDLLDREARGVLTAQERARLDAHLAACVACRFERVARDDFAMEDAGEPAHARLSGPIEDVLDAALHPDDLFDREARGQLTAAERALLDAHLASCAVCRFERAVRDDFADEAAAFQRAGGAVPLPVVAPLAAGPEVPDLAIAPAPVRHISSAPRARSMGTRLRIGLMAAAATFVVGAAAAAGFAGATRVFNLVPAPPPPASPVVAPVQTTRAVGRGPVAPRTTPAPVEAAEAVEPAVAAPVAPSNAAPAPTTDPAPTIGAPVATAAAQPVAAAQPASAGQPIHVAPSGVAAAPHAGAASPGAAQTPQVAAIPPVATPEQKEPARPEPPPVAPVPHSATAASMFADANAARRSGDDARATALYRELDRRHPDSAEAKVARATLGRMLLEHGDASAALERFDAYLEKSRGTLSEEAMIGRAEALRRLGRAAEEKATWQKFLQTYPGSPHAARARARISTLLPSIVARVRCEER